MSSSTWVDGWNVMPDPVKVAFLGACAVIIAALITFFSKAWDRLISKESKVMDDATKLRTDLIGRISHLEGRIDQLNVTNMTLARENADIHAQMKLYAEQYQKNAEESAHVRTELTITLEQLDFLREELEKGRLDHLKEREAWQNQIIELERQIQSLESQLLQTQKTT